MPEEQTWSNPRQASGVNQADCWMATLFSPGILDNFFM